MSEHSKDRVIKVLGIDLAKRSFHLHGVDGKGRQVLSKKLTRARLGAFVANLPALYGGDGGVRECASLGAAVPRRWARGTTDRPAVRQAVREVQQERRGRC